MQVETDGIGFEGIEISASEMQNILVTEQPKSKQPEPEENGEGAAQREEGSAGAGAQSGQDESGVGVDESEAQQTGPMKIKVGEREYGEDEIAAALEDARNKTNWQKTNTAEAQRIALMRKMVEPVVAFIEKLKSDGEFTADIKEAAVERFGEEFAGVIEAAIQFDPEKAPNPFQTELDNAKKELKTAKAELVSLKASIEGEKALQAELRELRKTHKLTEEKALQVLEFAGKKFEETGQALTLEDAFKLMDYEQVKKKAEEKKAPEVPKIPANQRGAKDIKSKRPGSYEEITFEGYDIFS